MDNSLIDTYRSTDYRVRLPQGGWVSIHVDAALPTSLHTLIGEHSWAFITAWNPGSQAQPRTHNHAAQQALLLALRQLPRTTCIRPGMGVGNSWREASLFVVGPNLADIDELAQQFQQHAYVHGLGQGYARLRLSSDRPPHGQAG
ncbi:DUF3293 domain-containing protein [Dyella acidiphila]|uniref:DUF3293 domain-containing protein n=1 Tax=Dyella acidiphila TaxID=2775866 RepID=A0ABR9GB90_9GAMM|nr:DUF3293 domain-containing protein [Dyella acidiphila]MBE1161305.1 DUF3293 domain-containing protein [Dyella acidiphila]